MTIAAHVFNGKLFNGGLFNSGLFIGGASTPSDPLTTLISSLFGSSEQGGLYLPSLSTCYTDNGTTLCTAPGDLVYRIDDLSGNENHVIQATEAARPALGRTVEGGLRNLWLNSEDLETAKSTVTDATIANNTITATTQAGIQAPYARINNTLAAAAVYTFSADVTSFSGKATHAAIKLQSYTTVVSVVVRLADGVVTTDTTSSATTSAVVGGWRVQFQIDATGWADLIGTIDIGISEREDATIRITDPTTADAGTVNKIQLELGATATEYQRIGTTALDVTEAGKAELWYLKDDGVDDSIVATFGSALGDECTTNIADSAGIDTLTAQTIGTTYDIMQSLNVFGAIVTDDALSTGEQDLVDDYLGAIHP